MYVDYAFSGILTVGQLALLRSSKEYHYRLAKHNERRLSAVRRGTSRYSSNGGDVKRETLMHTVVVAVPPLTTEQSHILWLDLAWLMKNVPDGEGPNNGVFTPATAAIYTNADKNTTTTKRNSNNNERLHYGRRPATTHLIHTLKPLG